MTTNDPLGTVHRMFAAFRAGDLDRILETVHSDSRWTYVGADPKPTRAELVGHASVRRFFEGIIRRLEESRTTQTTARALVATVDSSTQDERPRSAA
jgi:ketosteroid isomerase-like protein